MEGSLRLLDRAVRTRRVINPRLTPSLVLESAGSRAYSLRSEKIQRMTEDEIGKIVVDDSDKLIGQHSYGDQELE